MAALDEDRDGLADALEPGADGLAGRKRKWMPSEMTASLKVANARYQRRWSSSGATGRGVALDERLGTGKPGAPGGTLPNMPCPWTSISQ